MTDAASRRQVFFVNRFFAPDDSATSQMAGDVARELARAGISVAAITSRRLLTSRNGPLPADEVLDGVQVHRVWTPGLGRSLPARALDYLAFYCGVSWRLWRMLRAGDVVVAMTDPPLISVLAGWIARARGARLVNWLQDVYPEVAVRLGVLRAGSALVRALTALRNAALRRAVANVVLGERMQQHVRTVELAATRVTVIPNWFEELPPCPAPNPYRSRLGLADDCFVVGYAGNLGRAHRFDGLVEAARLLHGQGGFHFLIIGEGAQRATLQHEARLAGLDNFSFLDQQPRAKAGEFLRAIDLHLISLEPQLEGLIVPSKLYGVLAAGRASVFLGRADSEVATILAEAQCGATLPPGAGRELADLILRLSRDTALRRGWEQRAGAAYEQRFSKAVAMSEWRHLAGELGVS